MGGPGERELIAEVRWKPGGGEGVVPAWGADAGADSGENTDTEGASGGVYG